MGGSQGGLQALMTAGLHPKNITATLAVVPAGCDMLGPDAGRRGGWPQWHAITWGGKDAAKVHEASRYYDVANFAPHIQCPVLVGLGLIDETCPAAGIFATLNQVTTPKEVVIMPQAAHQEEHGSHAAYYRRCYGVWLQQLVHGNPLTVNQ
jgi:cephalosporin-C deacetylase